jgi:hypothetical protein
MFFPHLEVLGHSTQSCATIQGGNKNTHGRLITPFCVLHKFQNKHRLIPKMVLIDCSGTFEVGTEYLNIVYMHFSFLNFSTVITFHIETTVTNYSAWISVCQGIYLSAIVLENLSTKDMQVLQLACCVSVYRTVAADKRTQI